MNIPSRKWVFIVGVLIALAISTAVSGWMLYERFNNQNQPALPVVSPPVSSTNGVKTYTNAEYGFEFNYPEDWTVKEKTFGSYYSKFNLVVNPTLVRSSNFTISINIVLPEFPDRSFKSIEKTTSEVTVDGVPGIKYQYEFEGSKETAIILPLGEYKAILSADNEQYTDIFNQFLASFKFVK